MKYLHRILFFITISLLILSSTAADEYIVDNDDGAPGYIQSGDWSLSVSSGYNGGEYWYTDETLAPSYCIWTPDILTTGTYDVYAIYRQSTNRTPDAPYTVVHAGGSTVVNIDQSGANTIVETYLGEFSFNTGTSGYVRLDNNGGSGAYISDAIRFVTAVDDPPVINSLNHSPSYPADTDTVNVTANITDDSAVFSVTLYYISTPAGTSGSAAAYDDGAHNDGAAGDDVYGASIPTQPDGDTVGYYFEAIDDAVQTTTSSSQGYVVGDTAPREYRVVWADTWNASILNAAQSDDLILTCRNNNINTVMVEIRKIGDAYYDSNIEPRATNISGGPSFDPLDYLLSIAHDTSGGKNYIEVHGWFVAHRISKGETLDPLHVLVQHPEYIMTDSVGNNSAGSTYFLDPGHPGTVDHNVAVIADCLSNYAIDGINLDYIRYPEYSGDWGHNPVSIARFNAFYSKSGAPSSSDPDWADWRRECVTLEVKKIYIKSLMIDWDVVLTPDTVNWGYDYAEADYENSSAYAGVYQDWAGWLDQGIIDYNALMNYSTSDSRFEGWTDLSLAHDDSRGSIIGVGAYLQPTVQDAMDQLLYARGAGAAGLNIYDWGSEVNAAPSTRTQFYQALKSQVFPTWSDTPVHAWKSSPTAGIYEGNLADGGVPVDHGTVMIDGQPATLTYTDGSGWFGILGVAPGTHQLRFAKPGYTDLIMTGNIPSAGDIITVDADFATPVKGWTLY
jgi:uncharacterized lipoprotein YddW (UPF0748 family)